MNKTTLLGICLGIGFVLVVLLVTTSSAAFLTFRALTSLKTLEFEKAAKQARNAQAFLKPLSFFSLGQPDLQAWSHGLTLLDNTSTCGSLVQQQIEAVLDSPSNQESRLATCFQAVSSDLSDLEVVVAKTWFIRRTKKWQAYQDKLPLANQVVTAINQLTTKEQKVIILLQNSQELRATGGFMGSFIELTLEQGQIASMELYDIYQPDGQFKGYIEPPPGVAEYLSGGNGFRLPDANWHPDFPSAAEQILRFMSLAGRENISTVITINLSLAEDMLSITGDIELPDYDTTVTSSNLAQIARADRDEFFPGSYQKVQFLSALVRQLKLKLTQLPDQKKKELLKLVSTKIATKDILAFSNKPELEALFKTLKIDGQLTTNQGLLPFYLVESNVGINKANQQIQRAVLIDASPYRVTTRINFKNNNSADSDLHYGNYQRLLTTPTAKIHTISVDREELQNWDESIITTTQGERFKQIGFFVAIPVGQTKNITIEVVPEDTNQPFSSKMQIFKQPGLPHTPYTLVFDDVPTEFILDQDTKVDLQDIIDL